MANTPNIDLVKPAGTDHALVSVINSNSDKIDTFAGLTNQAIANMSLNFPLEDDTVAEIYARLNTITVGKTVTFYSAWKMLDAITSGQIQATATGVITRYSTGQFEFLFKYGAAEAATMRVEGMSDSSVGTVTLNKLALKSDVDTKATKSELLYLSGSGTLAITPNATLSIVFGQYGAKNFMYTVFRASATNATAAAIKTHSEITVSSSNGVLTFSNSGSDTYRVQTISL